LIAVAQSIQPEIRWWGLEINPSCTADLNRVIGGTGVAADFLAMEKPTAPNPGLWIITNPPYRFAQEFVEQASAFAARVIFLLRLNFLADGRGRRAGFAEKTNPGVLVLPNRPSFNGWGGDACEYGWFVYGDPTLSGRWQELGQTPQEEIERWNAAARKHYPEDNPKLRETKTVSEAA
jgi:hypothetical protein